MVKKQFNGNLNNRFRKRFDQSEVQPEEKIFNFWVEYFSDACEEKTADNIRFPVSGLFSRS